MGFRTIFYVGIGAVLTWIANKWVYGKKIAAIEADHGKAIDDLQRRIAGLEQGGDTPLVRKVEPLPNQLTDTIQPPTHDKTTRNVESSMSEIKSLTQLIAGQTELASETIIRPHIGKKLTISGVVDDVERWPTGSVRVTIDLHNNTWVSAHFDNSDEYSYFIALPKGSALKVSGTLANVYPRGVRLEKCEIIP